MICTFEQILRPYSEKNKENKYEPVAVGKYGIRKRSEIYKKKLSNDYSKNKLIYKDTMTVGMGSKQIDFGILKENAIYSVSPAYKTFRINTDLINASYLELYLDAHNEYLTKKYMIASARQGKKVDINNFVKESIIIPEVKYQKIIVDNIFTLKELINKDIALLEYLNELIKSRFVEWFGDPVINEKKWPTLPLEKACKSIVDCPHSTPHYTSECTGYMCIRTSIVKKNKILWDEIEYISEQEFTKRTKRKKPEKGDIVYTREGTILGIAAIIDRDCNVALGQRSMLLSPDERKTTSEFLCSAMNCESFLNNALKDVRGSGSPHINVGDIRVFNMIIPPIEIQKQFSDFVKQINKTKDNIQKRMDLCNELLDKKMYEYFIDNRGDDVIV